jgi:hypothetical protein
LAGAFSGLLAYGISFMNGTAGLLAWSWIFVGCCSSSIYPRTHALPPQILEGIATVLVGFLSLFGAYPQSFNYLTLALLALITVLVDFPSTAKFLTLEERAFVIWRKSMHIYFHLGLECSD